MALREDPNPPRATGNLAVMLQMLGRGDEALPLLRKAVEANPNNFDLRDRLCAELLKRKMAAEALGHLNAMLDAMPEDTGIGLSIAWLLSTLPDDSVRAGERAVRLAEACLKREGERADILDVLAAAYAEAGRFPDAVKAAARAFELQKEGANVVAPGLELRLEGYRMERPYRQ